MCWETNVVSLSCESRKVCVIPCEEQANLFPLVEQESSQGRQMDRGEVDVEEERQATMKSAPVLRQTERSTRSRMRHFAAGAKRVARRATEDSHNVQQLNRRCHLWPGLRIPRTWTWARSWCGYRDPTVRWELVRCFAKAQSLVRSTLCWHTLILGAQGRQRACHQALVDAVRVKQGERTMVEKSPKYSHQSNGAVESAVGRIESLTRTNV